MAVLKLNQQTKYRILFLTPRIKTQAFNPAFNSFSPNPSIINMARTQNPVAAASSDEKEKPKLVIDLNYPPAPAADDGDDDDDEIVKENNNKESFAKGLRGFEVGSGSSVSKRSRRFTEEEKGKKIIVVVVDDDDDEEALFRLRLGPAPAVKPDEHKALLQASTSCVMFRALIRR